MVTFNWLIPVIFSSVAIFGPVVGKRIEKSNAFTDDHNEVFSKFDGVWVHGTQFVIVRGGEFASADGVRLKAEIHHNTVKVVYPDGQVYEGVLSENEQSLIWDDGDVWTRAKGNENRNPARVNNAPNRPANVNGLGPYMPFNVPNGHPGARFLPINPNMQRGGPGSALIPELVPPPGFIYEFKNLEKTRGAQFFFEGVDTNEYKWEFDEIESIVDGTKVKIDQKFAVLKGKWQSNSFGHQSVHVYNANGDEMFKIRNAKHRLNPFKLRWSFRILPPGSKSNDDAIYTIIKDYFGKGFLWMKEEWRIYRGRKRDKNMIYYCMGNYINWDFKFYRNKDESKLPNAQYVAKIEQKRNAGAIINHNFLPDKFKLKVYPGEDPALLLAVSSIIDMTHDATGSQGIRPNYGGRHGHHYHHGHY